MDTPLVLNTTTQRVTPKKGIVYALENGDEITRINITNPYKPNASKINQSLISDN